MQVPCDVIFNLKPVITKHGPKNTDVFEVEPARGQIPAHSHLYATVTFSPPSMQVGIDKIRMPISYF